MKIFRLKSKKAFTLVEIVIVIAIIGVLAAILVPIMINVTRDANVASANVSASDVYKAMSNFILDMEKNDEFVSRVTKEEDEIYVEIFGDNHEYEDPIFSEGFWKNEKPEKIEEYQKKLKEHITDMLGYKKMYVRGYLVKGAILYVCYCDENSRPDNLPTAVDFRDGGEKIWGDHDGITVDGTVIGTYPVLKND